MRASDCSNAVDSIGMQVLIDKLMDEAVYLLVFVSD
jgi:hypothetical protein